MRKVRLCAWFLVLAGSVAVPIAVAKGAPDKITVSGGGLTERVAITDRKALKDWSPWDAKFIDWARGIITEPPPIARPYNVFFYVGDQMLYAVQYDPNLTGERGYIYLPGPQDRWYQLNIGTIIHDGHDGQWHYASAAWDEQMRPLLHKDAVSASRATLLPNSGMAMQKLWGVGGVAAGSLAAGVALLLVHRRRSQPQEISI